MIPGFNHNIKHQGRIYHVQTEDSGPKNPHFITHLFLGGNILASKKTEYRDLLGQPDYEKAVLSLMQEQHKQMMRNLVNGMVDATATTTSYALDGPTPINLAVTSLPPGVALGDPPPPKTSTARASQPRPRKSRAGVQTRRARPRKGPAPQ
jgi:hypothetical protein